MFGKLLDRVMEEDTVFKVPTPQDIEQRTKEHMKIWVDEFMARDDITKNGDVYDVKGSVDMKGVGYTELPVSFGEVDGDFDCSDNKLTTLKGMPSKVGGSVRCYDNKLTSLEGSPGEVGHSFVCFHNKFRDLKGGPKMVGRDFTCFSSNLISLEGAPIEVGDSFSCSHNPGKFTEADVRAVSKVKGEIYV